MNHLSDDIVTLFESQGSSDLGYRELARESEAIDAQQRWPLFRSLAPEKGEQPAALDGQLRTQLWHTQSTVVPVARHRLAPLSGGKALLHGLHQLVGGSGKEAPAVACVPQSIEPVRRTATWSPGTPQAPTVALAVPAPKRIGLFSQGAFADSAKLDRQQVGTGEKSLAKVFGRLADARGPVALAAQKPASFFARLYRR